MKKNLMKITAIFTALLFIVCYACQEMQDPLEGDTPEQAIGYAKSWYEANKPETLALRSSEKTTEVPMKPEWKNAFSMKDAAYEVVETEIMSMGRVLYIDKDCMEKFKETKDTKYKQCYTRLVFRTDRKTGKTSGFLMTFMPNLEWLEKSDFKPFRKSTYLKPDKDFGGMILFHNMDGSFSNGWVYERGKITGSVGALDADPATMTLRSGSCYIVDYYYQYSNCRDWYTMNEDGSGSYSGTNCSLYWEYAYSLEVCEGGGSSGGYTGGSGGGGSVPSEIKERNDCGGTQADNAMYVNSVMNNTTTDYARVKIYVDMLRDYAKSKINEFGMTIDFVADQYFIGKDTKKEGQAQYVTESLFGSATVINAGIYTRFAVHTHPKGKHPAPSPSDASYLGTVYQKGFKDIQGNIILASDGSEYVVYISNRSQFETFCSNPNNSGFFETDGSHFKQGTTWRTDYYSAYNRMLGQGFSDNDAQSYAVSYVLTKYNTGMVIMQRGNKGENFKEQLTTLSNGSYTPSKCK